VQVFPGSVR